MNNEEMRSVRVRYAPSPTGDFHVGGARTALFNYLFAKQNNGKFILRIEDTDRTRYKPEAENQLFKGLKYLGLQWDEGPDIGGPFGPYVQTQRLDFYQSYCSFLIAKGKAYRCFCAPESAQHIAPEENLSKTSGYNRHCRNIDPEEADSRAKSGEPHTVRIKIPLDGATNITDAIRGEITFQNKILQDAIIMKTDGIPTYHLANVIDDHLMKISHVLRGDEWVNSTPLHIHLYNAFDWHPPIIAHFPVILNPSGRGKMSKREGRSPDGQLMPVFVRSFQDLGYLPDALVNYLALLGWSFDDKTELMSRDELISRFSLDRVRSSAASWDYEKLKHFNATYIRSLSAEDLAIRLMPYLEVAGIKTNLEVIRKIVPLIQDRLTTLDEASSWIDFLFMEDLPDYDISLLAPKKLLPKDAESILQSSRGILTDIEFVHDILEANLRIEAIKLGYKPRDMFHTIRVAICGRLVAPPLFGVLEILGKEKTIKRINYALSRLK